MNNIYIIAAASGTGKTSLVNSLIESLDNIVISISHTTRPKRSKEKKGENYYFVDEKIFLEMIKRNEFLEYAKVFDHYYGTSKKWVDEKLNEGLDVILEIDWQGAQRVKKLMPKSTSVFVLPPSFEELKKRLLNRNQDHQETISKRLSEASGEMQHCREFDYILINDKFDDAVADLHSIIRSHRLLTENQLTKQKQLLDELK